MAKKGASLFGRKRMPLVVPAPTNAHMQALEPRILLDAAAVETIQDAASAAVHATLAETYTAEKPTDTLVESGAAPTGQSEFFADSDDSEIFSFDTTERVEIAFIAPDVPDIEALLTTLPKGVEVVLLEPERDGVVQMANLLEGRSNVDAIHILSHGKPGELSLGNASLNTSSAIESYAKQLVIIGNALTDAGDILIYGCDFGADEVGAETLEVLSVLTRADIAASSDITGHADKGGDWDLEVSVGDIEARSVDAGLLWQGTLPELLNPVGDQNDPGNEDNLRVGDDLAQEFTVVPRPQDTGSHYEVDFATIVLLRDSNAGGAQLTATIRTEYDGTILGSVTIPASDVTNSLTRVEFDFVPEIVLAYNQKYVLQVSTDSDSPDFKVGIRGGDIYSGHDYIDGDATNTSSSDDMKFEIHGFRNATPPVNTAPEFDIPGMPGTDLDLLVPEGTQSLGIFSATDAENDTLTYSISGGLSASAFTVDPTTGELSFQQVSNYEDPQDNGADNKYTVQVKVEDPSGAADFRTIFVEVEDIDEVPVFDQSGTGPLDLIEVGVNEGQAEVGVFGATTPNPATITYSISGGSSAASFAIDPTTGALSFLQAPNFEAPTDPGSDNTYFVFIRATNEDDQFDRRLIRVEVQDVDEAPTAFDVTESTIEDTPLGLNRLYFEVFNDPDDDNTIVSVQFDNIDPQFGTLTRDNGNVEIVNGTELTLAELDDIVFTPAENYNGDVTIGYRVKTTDTYSNLANIIITVDPVYDPLYAIDTTDPYLEDAETQINPVRFGFVGTEPGDMPQTVEFISVNLNAGDSLVYGAGNTPITNGTLMPYSQVFDVRFTPAPDSNADASFEFRLNGDGPGVRTAVHTMEITAVNDAPTVSDINLPGTEDTTLAIGNTNFGYSDVDFGDLPEEVTFTGLNLQGGRLLYDGDDEVEEGDTIDFDKLDDLRFVPQPNVNGMATFNFSVSDGDADSAVATMTLDIAPVNDRMVPLNQSVDVIEDTPTVIPADKYSWIQFDDLAEVPVSITFDNLDLNLGTLIAADGGEISNGTTIAFADRFGLTFTPAPNSTENASYDYYLNDADTGDVTGTMTLRLQAVNDAPTVQNILETATEDTPLVLGNTRFGFDDVDAGDAPTDPTFADMNLNGGRLVYNGGASTVFAGVPINFADLVDLTFLPAPNSNADVSFTYVIDDSNGGLSNTGTGNIIVLPENDVPTVSNAAENVTEDTPFVIGNTRFGFQDIDAGDQPDEVRFVALNLEAGRLVYDNGNEQVNQGDVVDFADLDDLTFIPAPDSTTAANFVFSISDGEAFSNEATFALNMIAQNDAPTVTPINETIAEDSQILLGNSRFGFDDVDFGDQPTTVSFPDLNLGLGTLTYNGGLEIAQGDLVLFSNLNDLTFTPEPNSSGTFSFTFNIGDGEARSNTETATITVTPANDAPTVDPANAQTNEDTDVLLGNTRFGFDDIDQGDTPDRVIFTGLNALPGQLLYANSDIAIAENDDVDFADLADLTFRPAANYGGPAVFSFAITDGLATSNTETFTINVLPVNDAPDVSPVDVTIQQGEPLRIDPSSFNFTDIDSAAIDYIRVENFDIGSGRLTVSNGNVTISDGDIIPSAQLAQLVFEPGENQSGLFSFDYSASDGIDESATRRFEITIEEAAEPVIADPIPTPPPAQEPDEVEDEDEEEKKEEVIISDPPTPVLETGVTSAPDLPTPPAPPTIVAIATVAPPAEVPAEEPQPFAPQPQPIIPEPIDITPDRQSDYDPEPISQPTVLETPQYKFTPVNKVAFDQQLDKTGEEMRDSEEFSITTVAKASFAFSSVLSVGSVAWMLRGGALAAAFLSALPAWNRFDPISIVAGNVNETESDDTPDVDMMRDFVNDARSRVKEESFL
ncbi:tandem-95 repeat protein [Pseudahrensia aquimaris]|uniref:Tandem-95 repeat protein n=1 Tax=Pseudahrensia aquimaris TaxID=744461 RepID=A0ABW3FAF8_9HYPH